MYPVLLGWNNLYLYIKSICYNVSFKTNVFLLIFCLDDLSIDIKGVLKSPTIIVLLSISPFLSVNIYFIFDHFHYHVMPFFVPFYSLCFKVYFI